MTSDCNPSIKPEIPGPSQLFSETLPNLPPPQGEHKRSKRSQYHRDLDVFWRKGNTTAIGKAWPRWQKKGGTTCLEKCLEMNRTPSGKSQKLSNSGLRPQTSLSQSKATQALPTVMEQQQWWQRRMDITICPFYCTCQLLITPVNVGLIP